MNVMNYLQFFDGLAEKQKGRFMMETRSKKAARQDQFAYICDLTTDEGCFTSVGSSRKEALKELYRQLRKYR